MHKKSADLGKRQGGLMVLGIKHINYFRPQKYAWIKADVVVSKWEWSACNMMSDSALLLLKRLNTISELDYSGLDYWTHFFT